EFLAALREVVEREDTRAGADQASQPAAALHADHRGITRNVVLNPRSASGEVIPTSLNASALRDPDGKVIGAIGILRDMRELDKARAYAESLIKNAPDPVFVCNLEGKILQANDAANTGSGAFLIRLSAYARALSSTLRTRCSSRILRAKSYKPTTRCPRCWASGRTRSSSSRSHASSARRRHGSSPPHCARWWRGA